VARADAIVGERTFASEAKKVLFMLATVAVWFGIINAAREIAKEAPITAASGWPTADRPTCSPRSQVCAAAAGGAPERGAAAAGRPEGQAAAGQVLLPGWLELYITTLLTSLAGLAMGLAISSAATTPDRAIRSCRWR
jgi:hypothetical protein